MLMLLERLRFSWWNTGLTPPTKHSRGAKDNYIAFTDIISVLIKKSDFIGLCEVGQYDSRIIEKIATNAGWNFLPLLHKTKSNRTYFDHAVLFNPLKVSVEHFKDTESNHGGKSIKVAQWLKLKTTSFGQPEFHLFLSHWPSKILDKVEERENAASALRFTIAPLLNSNEKVILMGDYNESPFSKAINIKLQSSKCYDAVISSKNQIIYNPFWKLSISDKSYSHLEVNPKKLSQGSYYYNNTSVDLLKFLSYDQILLSSNFLGSDEWHLDESRTELVLTDQIVQYFEDSSSYVDHYPITLQIVRV